MVIRRVYKIACKASTIISIISAVTLIAVGILIIINVVLRSLGGGIIGAYDMTLVLITLVYSMALAFCESKDGHISLELFVEKMPLKAQKIVNCIMYAIALVVFIMAMVGIWQHALTLQKNNEVTSTIHIPFTPFVLLISIGIGALCMMLAVKIMYLFVKEGGDD